MQVTCPSFNLQTLYLEMNYVYKTTSRNLYQLSFQSCHFCHFLSYHSWKLANSEGSGTWIDKLRNRDHVSRLASRTSKRRACTSNRWDMEVLQLTNQFAAKKIGLETSGIRNTRQNNRLVKPTQMVQ